MLDPLLRKQRGRGGIVSSMTGAGTAQGSRKLRSPQGLHSMEVGRSMRRIDIRCRETCVYNHRAAPHALGPLLQLPADAPEQLIRHLLIGLIDQCELQPTIATEHIQATREPCFCAGGKVVHVVR